MPLWRRLYRRKKVNQEEGKAAMNERESPLNLNVNQDPIAKRHKPSSTYSNSYPGKENILPKTPTSQGVAGFSAAFCRTLGDQTQTTEPVQITGSGNQSCTIESRYSSSSSIRHGSGQHSGGTAVDDNENIIPKPPTSQDGVGFSSAFRRTLGDQTQATEPVQITGSGNQSCTVESRLLSSSFIRHGSEQHSDSGGTGVEDKENIIPKPPTSQDVAGFSEAFRRTLGDQTQTTDPVRITGSGNQSCTIESRYSSSSSIRHGSGQHSGGTGVEDNDDADGSDFEPDTQFDAFISLCSEEDAFISLPQNSSIESRLLSSCIKHESEQHSGGTGVDADADVSDFEPDTNEDAFIPHDDPDPELVCPLCGLDISQFNQDSRQLHVNSCLDNSQPQREIPPTDAKKQRLPSQSAHKPCVKHSAQVTDVAPVVEWLHRLGLGKYEAAFSQQEIDWETLRFLTEEDIIAIGVSALGPRKKILQSLKELRERDNNLIDQEDDGSAHTTDATKTLPMNRLITDFFSCPLSDGNKNLTSSRQQQLGKTQQLSCRRRVPVKNMLDGKRKDVPSWCSVRGTPFRVDAFQFLRRDCSHWFLTHFHIDHYQGLTRSFAYGKIYCSIITAKLVNAKIGISWDKLHVIPLNQKINIAGIGVTCFDANHCPGSIIILFEPPNGKAVLHTGDFRFNEEMTRIPALQACHIHTLILDTTYCNPQYNFPNQEIVLQFVIEAIQAESFNPKTLFLIGSYTIGKERLFLEVARVLHKKIYVTAAKLRLLECLELPREDMRWFTMNELESHIHVVPMWSIASFKRLKQLSYQYAERFSLIVAFTPTGWTFGKGKKSAGAGRRWQQGTIIRYEVPYSEHCSFEELKEFVKFISPVNIIPSVNNEGEVSTKNMTTLLLS